MKNLGLFIGVIAGTFAIIAVMAVGFSQLTNRPIDQTQLLGDARTAIGPEDAPVTIVEFSDYQCPACASVDGLVTGLLTQYPEQVRFVYRHFPLESIHPYALDVARVSEYAREEGLFKPYTSAVFAAQSSWRTAAKEDMEGQIAEVAEELGLDPERVAEIFANSGEYAELVRADQSAGFSLGVNGTPTFFVNGERVQVGDLQQTVENLLK